MKIFQFNVESLSVLINEEGNYFTNLPNKVIGFPFSVGCAIGYACPNKWGQRGTVHVEKTFALSTPWKSSQLKSVTFMSPFSLNILSQNKSSQV